VNLGNREHNRPQIFLLILPDHLPHLGFSGTFTKPFS